MVMLKQPEWWGFHDLPIPAFMRVPGVKWQKLLSRVGPSFLKGEKFISTANGIPAIVVAAGLTILRRGRQLNNVPSADQRILSNISKIQLKLRMRIAAYVQHVEMRRTICLAHPAKTKFVQHVIVRWFEKGPLLFRAKEPIIAIKEFNLIWKLPSHPQEIVPSQI